jgi:signal transduction histidine kinase
MAGEYPQIVELVRLAVEHVAAVPHDEQRYLELNYAVDRAIAKDWRYRELLRLFEEGSLWAPAENAWAWHLAAGLTANLMGDTSSALRWLELGAQSLEGAGSGKSAAASFLRSELARARYHRGETAAGIETANRALTLAFAANSLLAEAYARHYLGLLSLRRREYPYARRQITAAIDLFARMRQRRGRARVLDSLAALEMEQGGYDAARALLEESVHVKEELRDLRGLALTFGNLARLHAALGDYEQARHFLDREAELTARVGDERNATRVRIQLGELHLRHHSPQRAQEDLQVACRLARERRDWWLEAHASFALAEAERQLGNLPAALQVVSLCSLYFGSIEETVMRDRAALRQALLEGQEPGSPGIVQPLERLRQANAPGPLAAALFEAASIFHERGLIQEAMPLYAEALDVAEPVEAGQLAAVLRTRADGAEARAWVDAMMTVKRHKDELEQAYGELRRVETLRDALTQMIVHDLKNPLSAITPWLEMVREGDLEPQEQGEYLQFAIDECGALLRMIEDLNDVGKMQSEGHLDLTTAPLDLPALIDDVARRMQGRAADVGLRIEVDEPGELPDLAGDAAKIRRVLENLVVNAIRYGRPPEGAERPPVVQLSVRAEPPPAEGERRSARVEVRDFGPGIPPSEADRVFEAYYQAEAGRKRKAGVGLGLAFCRMVVESHGGAIWTEPNPEGGSVFAFRLPEAPAK